MIAQHRIFAGGIVAVLGLHLTLLAIGLWPEPRKLWGDERRYAGLAAEEAESTAALWPPLYGALVRPLLRLGGGSTVVVSLAQCALLAGVAAVARDLWRRLVARDRWGDALALLVAGIPPLAAFAHYLWPEILHLALLAGCLWILAARGGRAAWLALAGALVAAALLTKHLLLGFLPVLALAVIAGAGGPRARLARLGAAAAGGAAVLAVWALAGGSLGASGSPGRSARFNLWVGLNERSRVEFVDEVVGPEYRRYVESATAPAERDAILAAKLRAHVDARGLTALGAHQLAIQYFRLLAADSLLAHQLPGGAIARRGAGYVATPAPLGTLLRAASRLTWGAVLAAAAFGIVLHRPRDRAWAWFGLAFLGYNVVLFFFLHAKSRYAVQLAPFLLFWALLGLRSLTLARPRPVALGAACALAAIALFFAFGGPLIEGR